jgi:Fe-S-cluster containining protein
MERRFACTACGKCCFGWLPLTISDALAQAGRFPLAVVWTPVRQASKAFAVTETLGTTITTRDKRKLAVRMVPTAYIPPDMACSMLTPDWLCGLQTEKPLRCRTMPFFPYRAAEDQADLLVPRPGWQCETGAEAPVVYRDKEMVDRSDFDAEWTQLLGQVPLLRAYAAELLKSVPSLLGALEKAAMKPGGGHVAISFASLLRHLPDLDRAGVAVRQMAALKLAEERVSGERRWLEYQRNYQDWAWEMERLS